MSVPEILLRKDTLLDFVHYAAGPRRLWTRLPIALPALIAYSVGKVTNTELKEVLVRQFLADLDEPSLRRLSERFAENRVDAWLRPEAVRRLRWHQRQGHRTALVSASFEDYLAPWGRRMGFHTVLGSRIERSRNRLRVRNCYGAEKTNRLRALWNDLAELELHVYGDSDADADLLSIATHAWYQKFPTIEPLTIPRSSGAKTVVSISLGSPARDHSVEVELLGQRVLISRQGTGGDFRAFVEGFRQLDGKVDAFGVGGAEFYMEVNGRRYLWRQLRQVRDSIVHSKVGDGNGIKHLLEPMAIDVIREQGIDLDGKTVAMTAACDRYSLAKALAEAGCEVWFGDFTSIGIPIVLTNLDQVHRLSKFVMPIISRLPFSWIYPVGDDSKPMPSRFRSYCEKADILAGDFLQIQANMPDDLSGKIIITNTTTGKEVQEMKRRGLHLLVTTTPRFDGRSFGTNVIEAVCRALIDKKDSEITKQDFLDVMAQIPIRPQTHVLNP